MSKLSELSKILRASVDPVFFAEDPYFLGLELWPKQREVLRAFYDPNKHYTDLILVAGMRSGKTFLGSVIAAYEAFQILIHEDPQSYWKLARGSPLFILNVAKSEEQAKDTVFAQIEPKIRNSPFFQQFSPKFRASSIYFPSHQLTMFSGTSSAGSMVGRTAKCVIFDELARFEESEKRGAYMIYSSLTHSTMTFKDDGHRVVISSVVHPDDIVMQLYHKARQHPKMLAFKIPTWEMNPHISFDDLEAERLRDPIGFWRDFGCEPTRSEVTFFRDPKKIEARMTLANLLEILDGPQVRALISSDDYVMAIDPALRNDAFGIAIGHKTDDTIYIDGAWRFVPESGEVNPHDVRKFINKVLEVFPVSVLLLDLWHFPELLEDIRLHGVEIVFHRVTLDDYSLLRERIMEGTILLPRYPVLLEELRNLILKGKKVDHPRKGSKDVSDAVANVVQYLARKSEQLPFVVRLL